MRIRLVELDSLDRLDPNAPPHEVAGALGVVPLLLLEQNVVLPALDVHLVRLEDRPVAQVHPPGSGPLDSGLRGLLEVLDFAVQRVRVALPVEPDRLGPGRQVEALVFENKERFFRNRLVARHAVKNVELRPPEASGHALPKLRSPLTRRLGGALGAAVGVGGKIGILGLGGLHQLRLGWARVV